MSILDQLEALRTAQPGEYGALTPIDFGPDRRVDVVQRSIRRVQGGILMAARTNGCRQILAVDFEGSGPAGRLVGERWEVEPGVAACSGELDHANAKALGKAYDFARPQPLGLDDSFGLGDRLGVAGPAHLRAMEGSRFKVVLAQQSIRELERTERTPDEVMDAATWAGCRHLGGCRRGMDRGLGRGC